MIPGASITPPVESATRYRALLKARRDAADATARAEQAYREAETARARLNTLETQHAQETR
ncbi:hypothetical protein ABC337_04810 [Arthrobacter sp. 1P04PC]|uniref:hypothetical protein n=1 Tax=unclassified Arthrobacter TaxID=235627 RepID=UPI0039A3243B